ncbi:MAG: DUF58 domain-containing protein [Planctomycetes bacterium]|nr:DUF58 domain-containing protein [Planctomycetota bacterium]
MRTARDDTTPRRAAPLRPEILAQVRRIQIRTQRMVTDVMAGGYTSVFRGAGIEFDQVRDYAEGDDVRAVDWNVTARTGELHVKQFMEERELTVLFLLDLSGSAGFGTFRRDGRGAPVTVREVAAEFCACLALAAQRNNDKAGMVAFTDRIELTVPARKGAQHVLRLIRDALALQPAGRGTDLALALDHAARVQRRRAVVFVVSDFLTNPVSYDRSLRLLARRHDVVAVRVLDPATRALPAAGLLRVRDPETGALRTLDTASRRVRAAYAARLEERSAAFRQSLRRARVDLLDLDPSQGLAGPILRFFRMRELRSAHG